MVSIVRHCRGSRENQRKHREYECLNKPDEQLQPQERDNADQRDQEDHRRKQNLAREDVPEQTET